MRRLWSWLLLFSALLLVPLVLGQTRKTLSSPASASPQNSVSSPPSGRLPVKRVFLYKNGVGYFEHTGRVRGNQELGIDFTSAQLNDVVKSLTVVDLGEGHISGVRYNSVAPLSERLRGLRLPLGEETSQAAFLNALRGAQIEVRNGGGSTRGRLLSVETVARPLPKTESLYPVTQIVIVSDGGEVHTFEIGPATSFRLADHDLNEELGHYLNLISSTRERDLRRMTISTAGAGEREIFVSYISEVPIWKSTYRILMPGKADEKPLLQGWAVVDNTVGEDWNNVELTLVAGAPQSFVQEISQPYYARRPVIALPESVQLTPQAHQGTMDQFAPPPPSPGFGGGIGTGMGAGIAPGVIGGLVGATGGLHGVIKDQQGAVVPGAHVTVRNEINGVSQTTTTDGSGSYSFNNVPSGNSALFVEAAGFQKFQLSNFYVGAGRRNEIDATLQVGGSTETVEVTSGATQVNTESATIRSRAGKELVAETKDLGDLFEYRVKDKITVGKNQSALVPIVRSTVEAEKVTLWNQDSEQPLRALWLRNSSGLTLDGGTFNVLEDETFAGEGVFDPIRAGERRLVSYAVDQAVRITDEKEAAEKPYTRLRIAKGTMNLTREQRESHTYTVHNADAAAPRSVIIEHSVRPEWKLASAAGKPEETSADFYRFRVNVDPQKTAKLVIEEARPEESEYELTDLDDEKVQLFVEQKALTSELEQQFRALLAKKSSISALEAQVKNREGEIASITSDQARVRENMKALRGSAEERSLTQQYARQLQLQEERLGTLHKEISDLQQKRGQAQAEMEDMMERITVDQQL